MKSDKYTNCGKEPCNQLINFSHLIILVNAPSMEIKINVLESGNRTKGTHICAVMTITVPMQREIGVYSHLYHFLFCVLWSVEGSSVGMLKLKH